MSIVPASVQLDRQSVPHFVAPWGVLAGTSTVGRSALQIERAQWDAVCCKILEETTAATATAMEGKADDDDDDNNYSRSPVYTSKTTGFDASGKR